MRSAATAAIAAGAAAVTAARSFLHLILLLSSVRGLLEPVNADKNALS